MALGPEGDLIVDAFAGAGDLGERILEQQPDFGRALDHRHGARVPTERNDAAFQPAAEEMRRQAHREQTQRRLAGVGWSGHADPLARGDAERDVADCLAGGLLVGIRNPVENQRGLGQRQPAIRAAMAPGTARAMTHRSIRWAVVSTNSYRLSRLTRRPKPRTSSAIARSWVATRDERTSGSISGKYALARLGSEPSVSRPRARWASWMRPAMSRVCGMIWSADWST